MRSRELLNFRRVPARLLAEEAAVLLGFKAHDILILVKAGLLKPLATARPGSAARDTSTVFRHVLGAAVNAMVG